VGSCKTSSPYRNSSLSSVKESGSSDCDEPGGWPVGRCVGVDDGFAFLDESAIAGFFPLDVVERRCEDV
jgi:hypothetical protein